MQPVAEEQNPLLIYEQDDGDSAAADSRPEVVPQLSAGQPKKSAIRQHATNRPTTGSIITQEQQNE